MIVCRGTCAFGSVGMSFMKRRFWPNTWIPWKCEPGQLWSESRDSATAQRQHPQSTWVETRYLRMLETGGVPGENTSSWNRIGVEDLQQETSRPKNCHPHWFDSKCSLLFESPVMWLLFTTACPSKSQLRSTEGERSKCTEYIPVRKVSVTWGTKSPSVQRSISLMKDKWDKHAHLCPSHTHTMRLMWECDLGFIWLAVVSHPSQQPIRSCSKLLNVGHLYLDPINEYGDHKKSPKQKKNVATAKGFWTYNNPKLI